MWRVRPFGGMSLREDLGWAAERSAGGDRPFGQSDSEVILLTLSRVSAHSAGRGAHARDSSSPRSLSVWKHYVQFAVCIPDFLLFTVSS